MTKPIRWPVRPVKTQISLGIRPVRSESNLSAWRNLGSLATQRAQALWSNWAGAQVYLSLCWMHRSLCWFCHAPAHLLQTEPTCPTPPPDPLRGANWPSCPPEIFMGSIPWMGCLCRAGVPRLCSAFSGPRCCNKPYGFKGGCWKNNRATRCPAFSWLTYKKDI